ncbi:amino acid ABC transporter substrate-binding protein [Levilactobacillus koreensis JCM 16448]|uniref:Amino acid ABC transporter substrate-binding protein n=1 Tax=Levilactobacillus koreensis TaxID=637971 RepID=A0AAC8UTQ7_9LACO|nr:amino acid ABC transporter substrate-binding protein [Levilactobacillus koreensis]AKP63662.1 amino acid ABC transporter substrate-binding protein [Levilactobacillus koreensis]KRK89336.1 amino acid ABC transporter substrate-binding protein [Levilactobacillus koreensis JCM 16448]
MRKLGRIWTLIAVMIGLSGVLAGCTTVTQRANDTDKWSQIKKKKKVVVGLDDSFVPMGFRQKSGKLVGYDIDLARAVFKLYGIKVDFQTIDWSLNVTELHNGTIDLIWNGFSITPQRAKQVAFSDTYLNNDQVLVTLKKSKIKSFADMQGKVLGAQTGSSGAQDIDAHPKLLKDRIKNHEAVTYDSFTNAFIDLNVGRIKGLLIDSTYANYYIKHQAHPEDYRVTVGNFPKEKFAVGLRKGDVTMRRKINAGLKRLAENGTLEKINEKWFGKKVDTPLLNSK